jgi:hypothetical protein
MRLPAVVARHKIPTVLALVVAAPIVIFAVWALITLNYTYSRGERAGLLQKISQRGWLCKTWEGELQLNALPGLVPEKFLFSVRSDSIASELNKRAGERVVLNYAQHKGVPGSCFGDTEYFVTGIRAVAGP